MTRYDNLHKIQQLDPIKDHCQIVHLMLGYEFPWDITRALEIALFRTYSVPSISALLDKTGEFHYRTQKRYDDTGLLVAEIGKWGYDSDRGREAIRRMNYIHGKFNISNEDFLYVLSTFIYEPIRWIDRFCWRKTCQQERLGIFYFWREVGQQMQIRNIPETYEEFEQYNLNYESENFRYSPTNQRVGESTRDLFLSWFPTFLRPIVKPAVYAMLDERMLDAFGFPHPPQTLRWLVENTLKIRGRILRFFPAKNQPIFYTDVSHRSYPKGYQMEEIGPPHLLESLNHSTHTDPK